METETGGRSCRSIVIKQFVDWLEKESYAPKTVTARRHALTQFTAFLETQSVQRVQDADLALLHDYHRHLLERKLTVGTIAGYLNAVKSLFAWMATSCMIFENPAAELKVPKTKGSGKTITQAQAEEILNAPPPDTTFGIRDRAILHTLYATGMTMAEFLGMTVHSLSTDRRQVCLQDDNDNRRVPISNQAATWIKKYLKEARPKLATPESGDTLWLSKYGRPLTLPGVHHIIRGSAIQAGINKPVCLRTLRRSKARHMLSDGTAPETVADQLGIHSIKSLKKLTGWTVEGSAERRTA